VKDKKLILRGLGRCPRTESSVAILRATPSNSFTSKTGDRFGMSRVHIAASIQLLINITCHPAKQLLPHSELEAIS
jgi:hypothetical protein